MKFLKVKNIVCTLLLTLVSATVAFAQDSDWYYDKPIKNIFFQNLENIKKIDLEGVTSSFISKPFTDDLVGELYERILALEYFEDVEIKCAKGNDNGKTVNILVDVKERPVVTKIVFTGNRQLHNSDLRAKISMKERDIFLESKMLSDERAVRNYYIERGFTTVEVSSSVEERGNGFMVVFRIEEGKQSVVKKISFAGNSLVSSKTLKSKLKMKETGLFSKGSYQESLMTNDSRAVQGYYMDRGYIDARVVNVAMDSEFNEKKHREELTITYEIVEGSQYTYSGLEFEGNTVFTNDELSSFVSLKEGSIYNETKFQESRSGIQNKYYENGYTANQFYAEPLKDTEARTIGYIFHIQERPRSHIENIIIRGNEKTKEYVLRREIPIDEGDIFSNKKISNGMRNLYNLQFFSTVTPEVVQGSEENLVDIVYTVEEQSTTSLDLGFTFQGVSDPNDFPVALYAKLQESNLFGEARSASIGTTLSTTEQSVTLGYGQRWIYDLPMSFDTSLTYSHSTNYALRNRPLPDGYINDDYYYMKYEQSSLGVSAGVGKRWNPLFGIVTWGGGISTSIINNDYDDDVFVPYDSSVSMYRDNWEPRNCIWTSVSLDGRNIAYDPSTGWFTSQKFSWYGLVKKGALSFAPEWGETEFYLRTDTKAEKYFTLLNQPVSEKFSLKAVLMLYSGLSLQFPTPNTNIKRSSKLYIDGMFNGRGWTVYNKQDGRGSAMLSNTAEIRIPVLPGIISFDIFGDAVAIKDTPDDMFSGLTKEDWYFSFGPSLRFALQQFPLRLIFANTGKFRDGKFVFTDGDGDGDHDWRSNWRFVLTFNMTNH